MQKKYLLLSVFLLFSCNQIEKRTQIEWEEGQYVKGDIKSIKETIYKAEEKFGEVSQGRFRKQTLVLYNEEGKMSETTSYDFAGNVESKVVVTFNEKGNNIESVEYNSEGNLYKKIFSKYNDKNQRIEEIEYNDRGNVNRKWIYSYDNKGNRIKVNYYDKDFLLYKEYNYEYDNNDNNVKILSSEKDIDWKKEGYPYTGTRTQTEIEIKYDNFGNPLEGKKVEIKEGKESMKTMIFKYNRLDEKGNFIKRILYTDGKAKKITEREITYYDKKFW